MSRRGGNPARQINGRLWVVGFVLAALLPHRALALPLSDWLGSAVGRYLILETPEGSELFARLVGSAPSRDAEVLSRQYEILRARLSAPELSQTRQELERRIKPSQELKLETALLSVDDRMLLSELARRNLALKPAAELEFVSADEPKGFEAERQRFAREGERRIADPADAAPADETPESPAQKKGAAGKVREFVREMRECVASLPPQAAKKSNLRYQLTQWGIDESMTVTGSVIASGVTHVDWKNLPSDILFDSMSSLVGSRILTRAGGFRVRWFRMSLFGVGQAGADAIMYHLSPIKDTYGASATQADLKRFEYNVGWNLAYAPVQVALYELVSGLECLYPGAKVATATTAIRLGASFGSNIAYFKIRRHYYGLDHSSAREDLIR